MNQVVNPALAVLRRAGLGLLGAVATPALGGALFSLAAYLLDDDRSPATLDSVLGLAGFACLLVLAYGWPYILAGLFALAMLHAFRRSGPVSSALVGVLTTIAPIAVGVFGHRASFVAEVAVAAVVIGAATGLAVWALTFRRPS
jgi:hypothetical protein